MKTELQIELLGACKPWGGFDLIVNGAAVEVRPAIGTWGQDVIYIGNREWTVREVRACKGRFTHPEGVAIMQHLMAMTNPMDTVVTGGVV